MVGGNPEGATEKRSYGLPPLVFVRAIMDAQGLTREQLASRSTLSQPTITCALDGKERVRSSTADKVARALGVPTRALYDDLAFAELRGALKLPPVVAGRGYGYPGEHANEGGDAALTGGFGERKPDSSGRSMPSTGEREYVILHREQWQALHETLSTISGRLSAMEEAVGELATRPIAEFDVKVELKERGRG